MRESEEVEYFFFVLQYTGVLLMKYNLDARRVYLKCCGRIEEESIVLGCMAWGV